MSGYQLPILLYHRIVNKQSKIGKHKIYVWEKNFRKQMQFLKESGYETITFEKLSNFQTLKQSVILTFDDGYEDNYSVLFPILKEFGFTAVIYLVTKKNRNEWAMKEGEPELKMMNEKQIREMSDYGIEFGGHTQNHLDLTKISIEEAKKEIEGCKKDVETITGKPAVSFAYPFGALNEKVKSMVKDAGYHFGIATTSGANLFSDDKFQIRRIEIRPKNGLARFKFKTSGYYFQKLYIQQIFS